MMVSVNKKNSLFGGMVAGLMITSLALTGCLTDDKANASAKVTIADLKANPASVKAGETANIEGTITSANALTSVKVTLLKGASEITTGLTITSTGVGADKKAWSLKTDGAVKVLIGAIATGDYTVKVLAVSGTDSATATTTLSVTGTAVTSAEVVLGANQNANPGSIDLDLLKAYTHADAKAVSGTIDLYYAHSVDGDDKLFTPAQAKISGFGSASNGPATWTSANATEFKKLTVSESEFNAVSTQEAIDALWATGTAVTGSSVVTSGATFVVNTDKAKKVLVRVTAYTAGDAGTITIKGTK